VVVLFFTGKQFQCKQVNFIHWYLYKPMNKIYLFITTK